MSSSVRSKAQLRFIAMPEGESFAIALEVLDSLMEGCQVIGPDFTYRYVNPSAARQGHRGPERLVGRTMMECYPGIELTPMFAVLRSCMVDREPRTMLNEFTLPDGSIGWFELRFMPTPQGVCILSLDVTERKRTEAALARTEDQLRLAQKMEAVGRLAGGISHDFNNLLSVVLSYTSLILGDIENDHPLRGDIVEIQKAAVRAAELTHQLLAFSRRQVLAPTVLDLGQVVENLENMIRRLLGAHIELTTIRAPGLGAVHADAGRIEQILMNLVVNASDAMPSGGKLTIQTKNVDLDEAYASGHLGVRPGPYVLLGVSDTGVGMDKETQARVFEPFFTTKEQGKGTGLGLSTVFGIVQQSGGHIWLYSEQGRGTTFKIYFPRTDAALTTPAKLPAKVRVGGSETILLVEDEEQVRGAARDILRRNGYVVIDVATAEDALNISENHGDKIDLLLTDLILPRTGGRDLARRVRLSRPHVKVLFMSGYTGEAAVQHGVLESGSAFVQKPITPDSLTERVRAVLDLVTAEDESGKRAT